MGLIKTSRDILEAVFDAAVKRLKVDAQLTGSSIADTAALPVKRVSKSVITTVINAASVAAGGNTGLVSMGLDGTEKAVLVLVNIDQQPWMLSAGTVAGGDTASAFYPVASDNPNTYPYYAYPWFGFYTGLDRITPSSLADAILASVITSGAKLKVYNKSTATATVTVRVVRLWG